MSLTLDEYIVYHEYTMYSDKGSGFTIARYKLAEKTKTMAKKSVLIAKGIDLPTSKNVRIVLQGEWKMDTKHSGQYLAVQASYTQLPSSREGVISYLASLGVGIGKKTAELIFARFGESTWNIIENEPESLLPIKGVSKKNLKKLKNKLDETQIIRKLLLHFSGCDEMTPSRAKKLMELYGNSALEIVQQNPYVLCDLPGFGFLTVDELAKSTPTWDPEREERLLAGVQAVFQANCTKGHTCVPKELAIRDLNRILSLQNEALCKKAFNLAFEQKKCVVKGNYCYSKANFHLEKSVATNALRLIRNKPRYNIPDSKLDAFIASFEEENNIQLAGEQKKAVKMCFKSNINIITGGPGTGKSTIIKAVLFVATIINQDCKALLMAPTGRAARRMNDATGVPASTIHSALDIRYGDDGKDQNQGNMAYEDPLDADIIIVDEVSMVDQYIAKCLFSRIGNKTIFVLVGDRDQLPSVGAGNVLKELIDSNLVPVSRLNVIFRQRAGDPIIINSRKILNGETELMPAATFKMFNLRDPAEIFATACKFYLRCVTAYGIDNVIMLVPHRRKGQICSDALNAALEKRLNPEVPGQLTMRVMGREFRAGDKVMQTVNTDNAKNGDIGTILNVENLPDPKDPYTYKRYCTISFEGGIPVSYTDEDMRNVDWAYATSIHKSQGQEYKTVIVVMSGEHDLMARRNLLYTAVTRAKNNVALIGEMSTFQKAISNCEAETRHTQLSTFIQVLNKTIPEGIDPRYYRKNA